MGIGYKLRINGGTYSNEVIDVGSELSCNFNVETGIAYTVQVASYDSAGNQSAWSAPVTQTAAPTDTSPIISTTVLPGGTVDTTYNFTIKVEGGDGAIAFKLQAGSLPSGMNLNASTGKISGVPTVAGASNFIIRATDSDGDFDEKAFAITVKPAAAETNADAPAFIAAAAITDSRQQAAIYELIADLKSTGIWTKLKAIYPMVGGTENSHKFNLKDPRDADDANRLTFSGNWSHSAGGALPDGSTAYANTHLNPARTLNINEGSLSYYSHTDLSDSAVRVEIGCLNKGSFLIQAGYSGNFCAVSQGNGGNVDFMANADSSGFFQSVRTGAATTFIQRNSNQATFTNRAYLAADAFVFLGAWAMGDGEAQYFSNRECAFASIGNSLTSTEAAMFYTIVRAFQAAVGRLN
jgi:hypothetical protein